MAAVRFYTGLADRLDFALRLLRRARREGLRVQVLGQAAQLQRLSQALWLQPGFAAHAMPQSSAALRARSPLRLEQDAAALEPGWAVLNLGQPVGEWALRAARVFELVAEDETETARGRFRAYRELGLRPEATQVNP